MFPHVVDSRAGKGRAILAKGEEGARETGATEGREGGWLWGLGAKHIDGFVLANGRWREDPVGVVGVQTREYGRNTKHCKHNTRSFGKFELCWRRVHYCYHPLLFIVRKTPYSCP